MTAGSSEPLVTVCIPALNEEHSISAALDSVLGQTWRNLDVMVVDGGSTDATRVIVADYTSFDPRVRLVENPGRIQPAAMNVALATTEAEWLVRVDAHSTVPPGYVEGVMAHLSSGRWGGVGGRKDGVAFTGPGRAIAAALGSPFGVGNSTYHHGTATETVDHVPFGAYPVDVARELGGWDETITCNEDYEFDYRLRQAGHELLFDPSLVIWWQTRESVSDLARQYRRYGAGKAMVVRRHPESAAVRHVIPAALVVALATAVLVAPRRPQLAAAAVAPYLGVLAAGTVEAGARAPGGSRRWLPAAFAAMHLSYGVGWWQSMIGAALGRGRLGLRHPAGTVGPVHRG